MSWPNPNNAETIISAQAVTAGSNNVSSEVDQDSTRWVYMDVWLQFAHGTAPSANSYFEFYVLRKEPGGANYEDGGASVDPKQGLLNTVTVDFSDTNTHYAMVQEKALCPLNDFKILAKSESDQTCTITLKIQRYNEPTS